MKNLTFSDPIVLEKLRVLFNAEKQLMSYLHVIQNKTKSPRLQPLLDRLIEISLRRINHFNLLFKKLNLPQQGVTCEAMNGLIRENLSLITLANDENAKEYAITNFLLHINHYKMIEYNWLNQSFTEYPKHLHAKIIIDSMLKEEKSISRHIAEMEELFLAPHQTDEQFFYN